jgi:hypothetical protein
MPNKAAEGIFFILLTIKNKQHSQIIGPVTTPRSDYMVANAAKGDAFIGN